MKHSIGGGLPPLRPTAEECLTSQSIANITVHGNHRANTPSSMSGCWVFRAPNFALTSGRLQPAPPRHPQSARAVRLPGLCRSVACCAKNSFGIVGRGITAPERLALAWNDKADQQATGRTPGNVGVDGEKGGHGTVPLERSMHPGPKPVTVQRCGGLNHAERRSVMPHVRTQNETRFQEREHKRKRGKGCQTIRTTGTGTAKARNTNAT